MGNWEYSEFLPRIASPEELAEFLGADIRLLYKISNDSREFYHICRIPKSNGKFRTIEAPSPILKRMQRKILRGILMYVSTAPAAAAFLPGKSIADNAAPHVGRKVVLKLDVKEFFPSLKLNLVYDFFRVLGYDPAVAALLCGVCCRNGHLPQGSPASPYLSNLLMLPFDRKVSGWIEGREIACTRYADDITFSGDIDEGVIRELVALCRAGLRELGLTINRRKIKVQRRGARQTVTGVVVNSGIGAARETVRMLRTKLYYYQQFRGGHEPGELDRLIGLSGFVWNLDRSNERNLRVFEQLREIRACRGV